MVLSTSSILAALTCASAASYLVVPKLFPSEHQLFREARSAQSAKDRPYALITASSAGIGYGIAHELCRSGFNVIIHGRDETHLKAAVETLQKAFPNVLVESIRFDTFNSLAKDDLTDDVKDILQPLSSRNIRLLVNNVGTGFNPYNKHDFAPFQAHSQEHIADIINVNIRFTSYLTWYFLKQLEDNAKRAGSRSILLNISSIADLGIPWLATYSASKAYITCFAKALNTEMQGEGVPVDVKVAIPGSVDTPNCKIGVSFTQPSSEQMGREIVDMLKDARSGVVTVPNRAHWLQTVFCSVQPYWLLQKSLLAGVAENVEYRKRHRTRTWRA